MTARVHRMPAASVAAERSVLATCLARPDLLDELADLPADDFAHSAHQAVWASLLALRSRGSGVDSPALIEELGSRRAPVSDPTELVLELTSRLPDVMQLEGHASTVRRLAQVRRLVDACQRIAAAGQQPIEHPATWLDDAEAQLLGAASQRAIASEPQELGTLLGERYLRLQALHEHGSVVTGIPSGLHDLDRRTSGWHAGELVVLAGRPAMGKSALAGKCALEAAAAGYPVAIFSLEMPRGAWADRMLASEARVLAHRMRTASLVREDWERIVHWCDALSRLPIVLDDEAAITLPALRAKCRRIKRKHGLALVIVDYLQLMRDPTARSREQEIGTISRGLKQLAKELDCAVLVLSQLNRECERRVDKRPQLSDIRESGAVEQDADVIAFVYRDEYYRPDDSEEPGIAEVIIGKQRSGPTGVIKVAFDPETLRFASLAQEDDA